MPFADRHYDATSPIAPVHTPVAGARLSVGQAVRRRGITTDLLRIPLALKLLGANVLIAGAALGATATMAGHSGHAEMFVILVGSLTVAMIVNVVLVAIALRPLSALTAAAERVRKGELDTRVRASRVADRDLVRLGSTLNALLDELGAERARLRELAAEVISAGDREREHIARELHDSTAQRVAALVLHLGAVLNDGSNEQLRARLAPAKAIADEVLEELRTLAHVMHPRVLQDLGLPHALNTLARETSGGSAYVETDVQVPSSRLPIELESVLYRVAQEAVSNALRHGQPSRVTLTLRCDARQAALVVQDDGRGFDASGPARAREGLGLFTMRERVALVDGTFEISSRPGAGTRVRASVPLGRRATWSRRQPAETTSQ